MSVQLITDRGRKCYAGSKVIEIYDYAVIYEQEEMKRVIAYLKQGNTVAHNVVSASLEDHKLILSEITAQLKLEAEKEFYSKVGHAIRVGDVLIAYENIKAQEKNMVHFYQVLEVEKGASVTVIEIEAEEIAFKNHFKAIPLTGLVKEDAKPFKVDVIKNSIKTPEGLIAFNAEYTTVQLGGCITLKKYAPVSYGLVI